MCDGICSIKKKSSPLNSYTLALTMRIAGKKKYDQPIINCNNELNDDGIKEPIKSMKDLLFNNDKMPPMLKELDREQTFGHDTTHEALNHDNEEVRTRLIMH